MRFPVISTALRIFYSRLFDTSQTIVLSIICIALTLHTAVACLRSDKAIETSRHIQIDATGAPIFGRITRYAREPSFLNPGEVVFTFDDGPSPSITRSILESLDEYCVKATFFPVGRMAAKYPGIMREIAEKQHTIGGHTWSHPRNLRRLKLSDVKQEIEKGFAAIALATGRPVAPFFRFPGLNHDDRGLRYLQKRGIATFSVDVVSDDSFNSDVEKLVEITMSRIENERGGILLFHDIKRVTAKALPRVLEILRRRNYKVVHLTTKFAYSPMDEFDEELVDLVETARRKDLRVSLAGFQGTVQSFRTKVQLAPPITHLAPAAKKIEFAKVREQRLQSLTDSISTRRWSSIVEEPTNTETREAVSDQSNQ
ncbi:MAG: polysaccharide deacetylase family protein [Hyphomicrobiaceae bacterium]